jgi:adenylosuccinate lyase
MLRNLEQTQGLVYSSKVLLALIEAGLKREDAYKIVQRHSMVAWDQERPLRELLGADPEVRALLSEPQLDALFDYRAFLGHVDESFRRLGLLPAREPAGAAR